ncbi:hypothetical protein HYT18_02555 [Candidatus Microgenomates bacterium]|nr:hypothetical protein [Candidatus Microgenomates bacterium]
MLIRIAVFLLTFVFLLTPIQTAFADTVTFSTPVNISNTPGPSEFPALAVDKNGTAHVFWVERHQGSVWDYSQAKIFYATKTEDDPWSEPIAMSGVTVAQYLPVPAVDENGTIHVVWRALDTQLLQSGMFYAKKPRGGSWSEPTIIPGTVEIPNSITDPGGLAVDESGTLHLVWHGGDGVDNGWYATKAPAENWTEPTKFLEAAYLPDIVVGPDRTLHVVTHAFGRIRYTTKPLAGSWTDLVEIPTPIYPQMPTLAIDASGNVHLTWNDQGQISYMFKPIDGNWSTPIQVSLPPRDNLGYPSLLMAGETLHVVWQGSVNMAQIFYASKSLQGEWTAPITISTNPTNKGAVQPRIAVGGGRAHIVWLDDSSMLGTQDGREIFWSTANVDTTSPVITYAITGTLGNNGWYTSDVSVSWNVSDPESTITSTSGCDPSAVTADTAGITFTCNATSAGGTASQSVTIKRDSTAPTVTVTSPDNFAVVPMGTTLNFNADDNLSALVNVTGSLSDGTTIINVTNGYTITQPGVYTLIVEATDSAGNTATETRYFVVYNPSSGFASGSGVFTPGGQSSDLGDNLPGLDNKSPARFGFVVKYNPGATTPDGQLEFQYRQGNFNLNSTGVDWLVIVNNNWAKFQGNATIKGLTGEYPFRVDARDGDFGGGNQSDRFIIKIWSPGANPDLADPIYKASGDLMGGNIVIHTQ